MKRKMLASVVRSSLLSMLGLAVLAAPARAQTGFANLMDHIHMGVPDQAKAVEWYRSHFGGEPMSEGPDRLMLGATRLVFLKMAVPKPTQGSVLRGLGFSVADLDAATKKLQADGVKVLMQPMTMQGIRMSQVVDPWGTLIDVVQDPKKLGLHHVYLQSQDPGASLAWFAKTFGGTVTKYGQAPGISVGDVWLLGSKGPSEPSEGHSIDHLGLRPVNVDASVTALKAQRVKVTTEPRDVTLSGGGSVRIAYIEGPDGLRIELVQRP